MWKSIPCRVSMINLSILSSRCSMQQMLRSTRRKCGHLMVLVDFKGFITPQSSRKRQQHGQIHAPSLSSATFDLQ